MQGSTQLPRPCCATLLGQVSVIQQLRARGASLIVVCNDGDEEVEELLAADPRCFAIPVPKVGACFLALAARFARC